MAGGYSEQDFANKIDHEGGIFAALQYGLKTDDLTNRSTPLAQAWGELEDAWKQTIKPLAEKVSHLLPDPGDDEDDDTDDPPPGYMGSL